VGFSYRQSRTVMEVDLPQDDFSSVTELRNGPNVPIFRHTVPTQMAL
jgi:hypothetical protein